MEGHCSGQFTDRLETEKGFLQYFGEPYWSTHAILSGRLDLLCYREIWVIKVSILLSNSVFFQCSLRIGNRWLTSAKVASSSSLQHETTPKRHATTLHALPRSTFRSSASIWYDVSCSGVALLTAGVTIRASSPPHPPRFWHFLSQRLFLLSPSSSSLNLCATKVQSRVLKRRQEKSMVVFSKGEAWK